METQLISTNAGPRRLSLPLSDEAERSRELAFWDKYYDSLSWMSNSKATCFLRCPRKYLYRFGLHLHPVGGGAWQSVLDYGTAMHRAIPIILSGGTVSDAYGEFLSGWSDDNDSLNDPKRNKIVAAQALQKLKADRLNSPYVLEIPSKELQVSVPNPSDRSPFELRFAVMIPGTDILFTGFTDGVGRNRWSKVLCVPEYKTTSQLGATFLNSWQLNPQLLGYAYAIQILYGETVDCAYVEGVQSAKTKQDNVQVPVSISQHNITDWIVLMSWVTQQIQGMEEAKFFPKNFAGCSPYPMFGSHGYKCEYIPLCKADNFEDFLPLYNIVKDDPYDLSRKLDSIIEGE